MNKNRAIELVTSLLNDMDLWQGEHAEFDHLLSQGVAMLELGYTLGQVDECLNNKIQDLAA
jgi:hypothetical protein